MVMATSEYYKGWQEADGPLACYVRDSSARHRIREPLEPEFTERVALLNATDPAEIERNPDFEITTIEGVGTRYHHTVTGFSIYVFAWFDGPPF